jgi:peptidoglycan pentaglycine glycine transferase (the first glycine)
LQEDPNWDHFVQSHADPHIEQLSAFGTFRSREGWTPLRIIARREKEIIGGAQILEHAVGKFGVVGHVARGPLLESGSDIQRSMAFALRDTAHQRHLTYLIVSLPYLGQSMAAPLLDVGFFPRPEQLPPANGAMATLVINLSKDLAAIFGEIRKSRRNEIRRGQRAGTLVRKGTREDVPRFVELVAQHCARLGVRSNMPGSGFAQLIWDYGHPRGQVHLFMAESDHKTVGALMIFTIGQWARAWRIGWNGTHADKFPTQVLFWETIRWAKEQGYHHYDFVGFDLKDAKMVQAGKSPETPFKCPISFFKAGWGGVVKILPGDYCYFPNPVIRGIMRVGGARLLNHPFLKRLTNTIHSRAFQRPR